MNSKTNAKPAKNKKPKRMLLWGAVLFFVFLLGSGAWSAYSVVKNLPNPERLGERAITESTKIYDRTGQTLLYEVHGEEKRTVIPLSQIPENVKRATLAAEDIHFYDHPGIDLRGIARALLHDIRTGDLRQGGSTITQQLVKNSLLSNERTFTRKIKEAILALMVERKYSKDEIFELYLNQIPYGLNAYGIAAAAETYFAKSPQDLTLAEAAVLAGLPKAPTYYSPYGSHKEALLDRKDWILDRIAEAGLADQREIEDAKKAELAFAPPHQQIRAPHFVMYVKEYLEEKYGAEAVERGGLRVITTLDWKRQEAAEKAIKEGAERNDKAVQASNAALVAIDPKTGEILAMVGSRDYFSAPLPEKCVPGANCRLDPHVNVALRPRQPGSAFKPFVYATAFKKGYVPETELFDVPTEFNTGCNADGSPGPAIADPTQCYHPQNYDSKFRGPVSLRQALAQSLNIPSVKLLYLAGVPDSIETAQSLGISTLTDPKRYGLSLVLGGAEVTLLDMVSAYGTFANDGILHQKMPILRIENSQGEVIEEKKDAAFPALDTQAAREISSILSDNNARIPVFSPTSSLYFPDRRVAAKTGTTQDYRDAWTVGYTPSLAAGVWVGNSNNAPMNHSGLSVMVAAPIWHKFMEEALADTPNEDFPLPEKIIPGKPALRGLACADSLVKIDKISKKIATEYTPPELIQEVCAGQPATILTYVQKDDPLGDPPANPSHDPQYRNWQAAIDRWFSANPYSATHVPGETDDVHTPEKQPRVALAFGDGTAPSPLGEITATVGSAFPLSEASLFINDELKESKTAPLSEGEIRFALSSPLPRGEYRIKVVVYDTMENKGSDEKMIMVGR